MRLGGRLAAAIEVLEDMTRRHRPVAEALRDWGLSHRFAGGGDRAAIGNIVYDALRRRRSAGWLLGADTPRAQAYGALLLEWKQPPEALNKALEGDRFAPALLTAEELKTAGRRHLAEAPAGVRADCPDWCVALLQQGFGETWAAEGAALAERPPLDLRVNTLKASRDKVLGALAPTGARAARMAPAGIRIPPIEGDGRHPNVQADPAFRKGWFEVQDEGSQIVAALAGAQPGMQVLDYCAGAGGKALALSATMGNRGQIFAHDTDRQRLAPIFERSRRSGCRNIQAVANPADLQPLAGNMDIVLVDAPCTGSGTWRRRPDAKWRLTEHQLEARKAEQAAILEAASAYVKRGGLLVYVTCSVFDSENGEQVAAFLNRAGAGSFCSTDHAALWTHHFPDHADAARIDSGISLSPRRSGTDGFFFAALSRTH